MQTLNMCPNNRGLVFGGLALNQNKWTCKYKAFKNHSAALHWMQLKHTTTHNEVIMMLELPFSELPPRKTVAKSLITILKQNSSQIGLSEATWFKCIDPEHMSQKPNERVLVTDYLNMWRAVLEITGDQSLGLKIGNDSNPDIGLLGTLVLHCATLREVVLQICRYQNFMSDAIHMQLEEKNGHAVLACRNTVFSDYLPQVMDQGCAFLISWIRQFSKTTLNPVEVYFQHSATSYIDSYRDVFQSPVHFDQEQSAILFSAEQLNIAIPDHDPSLKIFMLSNGFSTAASNDVFSDAGQDIHQADGITTQQVRKLIKSHLPMGRIGVDLISQSMKISRQTLYRRLQRENTTFLELLEDERQSAAIELLSNVNLTTSEIAILLGFSEPKSFRRAFKRWQGISPKAFRDRL